MAILILATKCIAIETYCDSLRRQEQVKIKEQNVNRKDKMDKNLDIRRIVFYCY